MRIAEHATARAAIAILAALALAACTSTPARPHSTSPVQSRPPPVTSAAGTSPSATPSRSATTPVLRVRTAAWRLPQPLSRAVAFTRDGDIVIAGGLTASGSSTAAVVTIDPATGRVVAHDTLRYATHDAAGFTIRGQFFVAGGGESVSVNTVQRVAAGVSIAGTLPRVRSDASGVTIGGRGFVVGGYDGSTGDRAILATMDGRSYAVAGDLPVPVRYAAVAAVAGKIIVFGGETASGPTAAIQEFDPGSGRARVVGSLPSAVDGAAAVVLGEIVYVCGGEAHGAPSESIWRYQPVDHRVIGAGRLPYAVTDPAVAQVGGVAYLLGGENPQPTDHVTVLTEGTE